jgi:hypothetical protein
MQQRLMLLWAVLLAGFLFPGQTVAQEKKIAGKYAGIYVNKDGQKSDAILTIEEKEDGTLTGKWGNPDSELTIENGERVTADLLQWEAVHEATKGRYRVRCTVKGNALVLDVTLTWKEDGKVKGATGTSVLVKE